MLIIIKKIKENTYYKIYFFKNYLYFQLYYKFLISFSLKYNTFKNLYFQVDHSFNTPRLIFSYKFGFNI